MLDFDFEKLCSVNLSNQNVYACLVCGKYFQGRGKETNAYTHSVQAFHHVFLNLRTLRFYCLPDGYEVMDASLEDIKFVLKPTFSKEMIRAVDNATKMARAYDGTMYFPGIMGLNNIKFNDYVNVAMQVGARSHHLVPSGLRPSSGMASLALPLPLPVLAGFRSLLTPTFPLLRPRPGADTGEAPPRFLPRRPPG